MLCEKCIRTENCPAKEEHGGAIRCSAYKPQEITNEEWLHSLNTEQLAKRLHNNDVYAFFVCKNGGKVPSVESYVEWLKQPHNAKE